MPPITSRMLTVANVRQIAFVKALKRISSRASVIGVLLAVCSFPLASSITVRAQSTRPEYRAYWIETFNTALGTHADIDRVIDAAVQSNANAIFAQVRRRGDSWYLDTKEPLTQVAGVGEPNASGAWTFDPLKYLIEQAHARSIEVHAYVIVGTIYNAHPTITGLPKDPNHIFNKHFWDKTTGALYPDADPRQWSTRSLPHNLDSTLTFNGHRYAAEWYVDLGHPDAAAFTIDVLTNLAKRYDVDGIHLDRIRYPEAPIDRPAGQALGINTGYNETSVKRFKARYGSAASYYQTTDIGSNVGTTAAPRLITAADVGYPRTNDPLWNQWRRDQVSNFVRRLYLNTTAVKPQIKVSAALICFFTGPTASGGWEKTEAYYRVFQDWRGWTQEGSLDIIAPMIYKQEHTDSVRAQYDDWLAFTKQLARDNNRHSMPGLGVYLNGIEGSLRQARRALARPPFNVSNEAADGVIFYALGNSTPGNLTGNSTNAAVTNNPYSYPIPFLSTPKRPNSDFFAALRTGASANALTRYEDLTLPPLFPNSAPIPNMPWKAQPTKGHVMGSAIREDGTAFDAATVTIQNIDAPTSPSRTTVTDGSGFYGAIDLAPGRYRATAQLAGNALYSCAFNVAAGAVTIADLHPAEKNAPFTTATLTPAVPDGTNGWYKSDVTISLNSSDECSGVSSTEYSTDGGATWQSYNGSFTFNQEGATNISYRSTDAAGNTETTKTLTVKIDKTAPTLVFGEPSVAPNAAGWNNTDVTFTYAASDDSSGVANPSGSLTLSEEGAAVTGSITITDLAGNSATFTSPTVKIDKTAPTLVFDAPTPGTNAAGWNNTNVSIAFKTNDALSGVSENNGAANPLVLSEEGAAVSGTVRVTDVAGNTAVFTSPIVKIDKTAPVINASRSTPANENGWNNTDVVAGFTASDALAGLAAGTNSEGQFTFTSEGQNQAHTFTVTDAAGNTAAATVEGVNIDKTAPNISATRTPDANAFGWNDMDVVASYAASDALAGLANGSPANGSFTFSAEGANQSHTFTVIDLAGNAASASVTGINIDKTAPTVNISADPSLIRSGNGGLVNVTISGNGTDALSGLGGFVTYTVTDEYGAPLGIAPHPVSGNTASWTDTLAVEARRNGDDRDGRLYRIIATVTDLAGHTASATADVRVMHDRRPK